MPYEQESTKVIHFPKEHVFQSAMYCIKYMGGKILQKDEEKGILHAQMDKKLFGQYLGDRSYLDIRFTDLEDDSTNIYIYAYPLNAIGQKLMFGARKGVIDKIIDTFYQETEKLLKEKYTSKD